MATTTPNFGWPVPTSTDLVKNGATAIEGLGDAIDASLLDLKGGTTGQYLTKATNTDMDFAWLTDTDKPFPYTAGRHYSGGILQSGSTGTLTVNTTTYIPIYISQSYTFPQIAIRGAAANTGSGVVRIGIYNNSSNVPSTVLRDAGTVTTTAGANTYTITINQALTTGWYWLAANTVTASTNNSFAIVSSGNPSPFADMGTLVLNAAPVVGYSQSVNATSGFATATGLTAITTGAFMVGLVA